MVKCIINVSKLIHKVLKANGVKAFHTQKNLVKAIST